MNSTCTNCGLVHNTLKVKMTTIFKVCYRCGHRMEKPVKVEGTINTNNINVYDKLID